MSISINLDNFEFDHVARTTPEILTSPRSLRACLQCGIAPNELVYRNLEEYEETLSHLPLSEVYKLYEQNETERQGKLLQCRQMRKDIISEDLVKNNHRFQPRSMSARSRESRRSRESLAEFGSDTESQGANNDREEDEEEDQEPEQVMQPSQSVPDLSARSKLLRSRGNLDFGKLTRSPRQFCPCEMPLDDNDIFRQYMKRYGDIISSTDELSRDDRKILELLILKKGREMEWDKRSQEIRKALENDRLARMRKSSLLSQQWQERLAEKRQRENELNTKRYLALEREAQEHRNQLLKYLDERDRKVQEYLHQLDYEKRKRMLDKQKLEALRQLEVGKAIERIMEEDRVNRQTLGEKLQQRMTEAEIRKRRREQDSYRHVCEMNRLEEIKRELKHEQVEQANRHTVERLRRQLEEKEHRATMNYLSKLHARNTLLSQGAGNRSKAIEKARLLHEELLRGLEEWHQKVLDLNLAAQQRASMNHCTEINRRRARVATERVIREERSSQMIRRVRESEERRRELVKMEIESKESKSERLKVEKERRVHFSRLRAQHAAELRQSLRERLDPETFDKKAARAEIELRMLRKSPGHLTRLTRSIPQINIGRTRPCTCGCRLRNF